MANLDGSRSHGGKWDILAGAMLRDEPAHFTHIYRTLITAARAEDIGADRLPDFLGLEHDGEFDLLGQDELGPSALENAYKDQIAKAAAEGTWTEQQTERQYYGRPPLRDTILLPDQALLPGRKYLDWHRTNIFAA
jgi:putative restriction endonuclease